MHTAITCFVLTARRHGVHTTVERVVHDYAIQDEPTAARVVRIAQDLGLKGRSRKIKWETLARVGKAFPLLCPLKNGNWVVLGPQTRLRQP
jgi:ATP-binding cassette subfamily B protein